MSERPIVENEADAHRVAAAAHALARLLVRDDPRVRAVYDRWSPAPLPGEPVAMALLNDLRALKAVLAQLPPLDGYRWLPKTLVLEFANEWARTHGNAFRVEERVPADLPWDEKGRAPKHGAVHHEDIDRYVDCFYRVRVKGESVRSVAKDYERKAHRHTEARREIRHHIRRVEGLLACID